MKTDPDQDRAAMPPAPNLPDQFSRCLERIRRDFPEMDEHDARQWAQEQADHIRATWSSVAA